MDISSILKPEAVRVVGGIGSKKRLFQRLGESAQSIYNLDQNATVEALMERESLGPTGMGKGIAIPHTRMPGLGSVVGLFFRIERAIDFDAMDRQPVDLVFALFAPENSGVDHLKALAVVSRTMRNSGTCSKLRSNDDISTLHTILTEAQATKAA